MPTIYGEIVEESPLIDAGITRAGKLILGAGRVPICVDTGFTGDIALPAPLLNRLELFYAGTTDYQLADGRVGEVDQWLGTIIVGDYEYEALFIEGDSLLGMDFLMDACRGLHINCDTGELRLTVRQ